MEAADLVAPEPLPDEIADVWSDREVIRQALDHLTADQRNVIVCKYILGYDNQKTARAVGKNPNAVNQLHHRALASLHRLLAPVEKTR